jgi:hypothetical protein
VTPGNGRRRLIGLAVCLIFERRCLLKYKKRNAVGFPCFGPGFDAEIAEIGRTKPYR